LHAGWREVDAINLVPDEYRGLDRFEARKSLIVAVVEDIDAEGLMIMVEDKKIMQPFGDRSKVVIEPMLTDQWFADAKTLAKPAIAAVETATRCSCRKVGEDLLRLDAQHPALVHFAPALVGPPDPGLVRPDGEVFVAEDRGRPKRWPKEHYGTASS
jgi:valyl-tRNA synthetase